MKRFFCALSLIFLLSLVSAMGEIDILTDSAAYNIGDEIASSASILADAKMQGRFMLSLFCSNRIAGSYSSEVSLEAGFRTSLSPRFMASEAMAGNCRLKGELLDSENRIVGESESAKFEITRGLSIELQDRIISAQPGGKAEIKGVVKGVSGNVLQNAAVEIELQGRKYFQNTDGGKFDMGIDVPSGIKSGKSEIEIIASDEKGNKGSSFFAVDVEPAHTSIRIVSNEAAMPGKKASFAVELADQAGDIVYENVAVDLIDEKGGKVFRKHVQSNTPFEYEFSQYLKPGRYKLRAEFRGVEGELLINLSELKKIDVIYREGYAFVENIGNVDYEDEVEFLLEGNQSSRTLKKKVSLKPAESEKIYLLRNLPGGIYDIKFIEKMGNEGLYEEIEKILAKAQNIDDKDSVLEKVSFRSIESYVVGVDGLLAKHPAVASVALVVIILLMVIRYSKSALWRIFRRK